MKRRVRSGEWWWLAAAAGLSAGLAAQADGALAVRLSWGHRSPTMQPFTIGIQTNQVRVTGWSAEGFEPGDVWTVGTCQTRAGAGDVDALRFTVSWPESTTPVRKPHEIWGYLLAHGDPGQVVRLREDPGLTPDAPVLTVQMSADGTRGFSVGLEQLARHRAMWLPEHDVYVTLADSPVEFATHLAALTGERVLERVAHGPEATLAEWTNRWADFGDPTRPHHGQETEWLGSRGHLTGLVARHGSLYKFGVDRWAGVRPDFASPHRFRLDLEWVDAHWTGQRIIEGLPLVMTAFERAGQRCEIEQFAAPLRDPPAARRGEVASVLFTRAEITGAGPVAIGFRLATENTNRHPELREVAGRSCVVDRETGAVWLMVDGGAGLTVTARESRAEALSTQVAIECTGQVRAGETKRLELRLASPAVAAAEAGDLALLEGTRSRAATIDYWESWLAQGARFEVPETAVNDLFRANLWHALMLPRHWVDEHGEAHMDLPYSNFAYGQRNADWPINQAVYVDYMLYGLRGYFTVADEEFAAMYRTQQKADGRVGGFAEWGVYSPGMLYAVAQNFRLSGDRAAFERLLPASLKALDWCLAEVARGRTNQECPGLVVAPLNDLTHDARAWAFPNAYFVAGLDGFGRALEAYGHPRAGEAQSVANRLRADVERAFACASVRSPVVQLADGTWGNYVPSDAMTPRRLLDVWYPTDVDCGPLHLIRLGAIDPRGWLATAMLHDHEDSLFLNQWGMANEPVYNPQATAYLLRDEPEAAIRAFYSMMACAFSHHQLTPLEHRWAWGQYYMPPSTDGAWFDLYRHMLIDERDDRTLLLGQAVPREWLEDGKRIHVERAPTYYGPLSFAIESRVAAGEIRVRVDVPTRQPPATLWVRLRHPASSPLRSVTVNGQSWGDFDAAKEWIRIPDPAATQYVLTAHY